MENKSFEEWIILEGVETARTYHFPDGSTYVVESPRALFIKKSGSHKITDTSGKLHYIRSHWNAFSADGDWKFNVK